MCSVIRQYLHSSRISWHIPGAGARNPSSRRTGLMQISIPWLLMLWWRKEPEHQQPWYWPSSPRIFQGQHQKGYVDNTFIIWHNGLCLFMNHVFYRLTVVWAHFLPMTRGLFYNLNKSWYKSGEVLAFITWKMIIRSSHNFAYVTAVQLLW